MRKTEDGKEFVRGGVYATDSKIFCFLQWDNPVQTVARCLFTVDINSGLLFTKESVIRTNISAVYEADDRNIKFYERILKDYGYYYDKDSVKLKERREKNCELFVFDTYGKPINKSIHLSIDMAILAASKVVESAGGTGFDTRDFKGVRSAVRAVYYIGERRASIEVYRHYYD